MNWYVMRTIPGKEQKALHLLETSVDHALWQYCRSLQKQKIFLCKGEKLLQTEDMFPGYLFIKTAFPETLKEELEKSRELPMLLDDGAKTLVPVEESDLAFLKSVCGEELEHVMGLSTVDVDSEGNIRETIGALSKYQEAITKKRLRKRFVVTEVNLFNRKQEILFGIRLNEDVFA